MGARDTLRASASANVLTGGPVTFGTAGFELQFDAAGGEVMSE